MKSRKGQAAMEFLMTYGWAILVVLIVIGALAYFGVLNPQSFLPTKCQFTTGLVCMDKQLKSDGKLQLRLNNGLGNSIKITSLAVKDNEGFLDCTRAFDTTLLTGKEENLAIADCRKTGTTLTAGQRIKASMTLKYKDLATSFEHDVPGTLLVDVEAAAAP